MTDMVDADRGDVRVSLECLHEMNVISRKPTDDDLIFWKRMTCNVERSDSRQAASVRHEATRLGTGTDRLSFQ